jgi:hypothetical protein
VRADQPARDEPSPMNPGTPPQAAAFIFLARIASVSQPGASLPQAFAAPPRAAPSTNSRTPTGLQLQRLQRREQRPAGLRDPSVDATVEARAKP